LNLRTLPMRSNIFLALAVTLIATLCLAFTNQVTGDDPSAANAKDSPAADNPYVPRDDLSSLELFELIERMKGLPKILQARPGFAEAIVICSDRILKSDSSETMRSYAIRAKMDGYQRGSIWSEEETKRNDFQKQLVDLANQSLADADKDVIHWAQFYLLEDKVLAAEELEPEKVSAVLDEARKFVKDEKLDNRHVRLASATVKLINKVPSDEEADSAYKEFGKLFAASTDDELHRYGDRIAVGVPKRPVDLTGKPMPITGPLVDGGLFDVANWKGKVVLIDFWATWCGPCRALLPELQAIHERYHTKGFEVIGISLDEDRDALKEFLAEVELPWPTIVDADSAAEEQMAKKYGIVGIPSTFLLDKEGKLVATNLHGEQLAAKIEELLRK
jgi:thiol-disulfide isomerase/thioredoxin